MANTLGFGEVFSSQNLKSTRVPDFGSSAPRTPSRVLNTAAPTGITTHPYPGFNGSNASVDLLNWAAVPPLWAIAEYVAALNHTVLRFFSIGFVPL